jgi:hypothetical protein
LFYCADSSSSRYATRRPSILSLGGWSGDAKGFSVVIYPDEGPSGMILLELTFSGAKWLKEVSVYERTLRSTGLSRSMAPLPSVLPTPLSFIVTAMQTPSFFRIQEMVPGTLAKRVSIEEQLCTSSSSNSYFSSAHCINKYAAAKGGTTYMNWVLHLREVLA